MVFGKEMVEKKICEKEMDEKKVGEREMVLK
jgi:hypothetical protein